jgi:hypothetical protein
MHADPVPQNSATGEGRRRIDRNDANRATGAPPVRSKRGDQRRFAGAGGAGHANDMRTTGMGEERAEQRPRLWSSRLDEGQRLRKRPSVPVEQSLCQIHAIRSSFCTVPE